MCIRDRFIHRLSNKALAVLTILLGVALASFAIFDISGYGNMGVDIYFEEEVDRNCVTKS